MTTAGKQILPDGIIAQAVNGFEVAKIALHSGRNTHFRAVVYVDEQEHIITLHQVQTELVIGIDDEVIDEMGGKEHGLLHC